MIYIGIDIGVTGAIAILNDGDVLIHDIPVLLKPGKASVKKYVDAKLLNNVLYFALESVEVCMEVVSARPGQGVASMFSLGHSLGVIEGVVASNGYSVCKVRPQEWKRHYGLIGGSKDDSISKALELFPQCEKKLSRKKDHNRADALLLANWIKTFN